MANMKSPTWWNDNHATGWERVKEALRRDWEQTKADVSSKGHELNQGAKDTVKQALGKEAIPAGDRPNPEVRTARVWDKDEDAVRYGYGAAMHYGDYGVWDDRTESALEKEWDELKSGRAWIETKDAIRAGWQKARS